MQKPHGFTLIEILAVLAGLAIIGGILITIIKPAEVFRCSRDSQRINDLSNLNALLIHYLNIYENPILGPNFTGIDEASSTVFISVPFDKETAPNSVSVNNKIWQIKQVNTSNLKKLDGNGWLPINLSVLGNLPINELPVDPINSYSQKLFYSYVFNKKTKGFELNANLECSRYQIGGPDDKVSTDGGDDPNVFEVGSLLTILPSEIYGTNRLTGLKPKISLSEYNVTINTPVNTASSTVIQVYNTGSTTLVVHNIIDVNKTGRILTDKKYLTALPLSFDSLKITCNGQGLYASTTVTTTLELWNNDVEQNPYLIRVTCNIQENPRIVVSPKEIRVVTKVNSSGASSFTIYNKGSSDLHLQNIYFYLEESTSSCKSFVSASQPSSTIPANGSTSVTITAGPTDKKDNFYCKYYIQSDDIYRPLSIVKVNITIQSTSTPPKNLRVATYTSSSITIQWSEPDDFGYANLKYYKIYRNNNLIATTTADLTSYTDSGLTKGTRYCYRVSAVNEVGESNLSDVVCEIPSTAPGAPTFSASAGNKKITLNWSLSDDGGSAIIGYNLYASSSDTKGWKLLLENYPSTSADHNNLKLCQVYSYYVEARNRDKIGPPSNIATATPYGTSSSPQNLTVSSGQNSIVLNWQAPTDANCANITGYNIYRAINDPSNFVLIATTSANTLTYSDTNITQGTTYYYYVTAQNIYGESSPSNQVNAKASENKCQPPSNLNTAPGDRKVTLNWNLSPSLANGDYYFIYYSTGTNYMKTATVTHPTNSYTHTGLTNGKTYYYYVTASGTNCTESNPSNISSSTPGSVPSAPRDFSGQPFKNKNSLSWRSPLSDGGFPITQYNLYRRDVGKIATLTPSTFSYDDFSIVPGTLYSYSISASNILGEGEKSTISLGYCASWLVTLGGTKIDWPAYSYITSDGEYLVIGKTYSFVNGTGDPANGIALKIDFLGNIRWVRSIGTTKEDSIRSAVELPDGFLIAGETNIRGNADIFLAKISTSSGDVIWAKIIGGDYNESNPYLSKDDSNNLYLGFNTNSWGPGGSNIVVMKLNSNADVLWAKLFGGNGDDLFYKLKYADGQVIVIGYTQSFGAGNFDFLAFSLYANNGDASTIKAFGGPNPDYLFDFDIKPSLVLNLFGRTLSFGAGNNDFLLMNVNLSSPPSQSVQSAFTFGTPNDDYAFALADLSSDEILLLGWTNGLGMGNFDLLLLRTQISQLPSLLSVKTFGGTDDDRLGVISQSDPYLDISNVLIAGRTKSVGVGDYDIILLKGLDLPSKPEINFQSKDYPITSITVKNVKNNIIVTEVDKTRLLNLDMSRVSISNLNLSSNDIRQSISKLDLIPCGLGTSTVPSSPQNLTVVYNNNSNTLNWQTPSNNGGSSILYYNIYRNIGNTLNYLRIATSATTSFIDNVGSLSDKYCYKVTAVNSIGESQASNEACIAPDVPVITDLNISSGYRSITLSWSASNNPTYYKIYRYINNQYLFFASTTNTSYVNNNLQPGIEYCYAVSAVNSFGEGPYSRIVCAVPKNIPSPPQALNVSVGNKSLNLNWQAPADDGGSAIIEYRIYRKISGATYSNLPYATTSNNQLSYSDTNVIPGTTYCYVVTAKNNNGESGYSNEVCAKAGTNPGKFSLRIVDSGESFVQLDWSCSVTPASPYCDGGYPIVRYNLYRSTDGVNYVLIANPTTPYFLDNNVTASTTYWYKVSAINQLGLEGPLSDAVSATTYTREANFTLYTMNVGIGRLTGPNSLAVYDAVIMWKFDLGTPQYVSRLEFKNLNVVNNGFLKIYCPDSNFSKQISLYSSTYNSYSIPIKKICSKVYIVSPAADLCGISMDNIDNTCKNFRNSSLLSGLMLQDVFWSAVPLITGQDIGIYLSLDFYNSFFLLTPYNSAGPKVYK